LTGSPGGSEIICFVAKNLILMLDMGMKPDKASSSPNLCATNTDPVIEQFTAPIPQIPYLEKKQEMIIRKPLVSGVTTILRKPDGGWFGAADPRREGVAEGS
jgi:gamma-glutamyltranspeptidase/glutathione hydrolase